MDFSVKFNFGFGDELHDKFMDMEMKLDMNNES